MKSDSPARKVLERLDRLAALTDEPGSICRTFLSPAMRQANELVGEWMRELGCVVSQDGWGNLIGHLPGATPEAPTLLLGSHLDTVKNAGKFDGPLGVLVALASLQSLADEGIRLPFHVDVLGFSDEEGVRFHSAYLGSKAIAGLVEETDLDLRDEQGVSLREAIASFQKTERIDLPLPRYRSDQLLGYVEVHIEQGPLLQDMNLPLGVVDFIAAQNRFVYTLEGSAGHAGTTPMNLRRDALAGAAEFILAVERKGRSVPGLVATVGQMQVGPGASNVISDNVRLSLDIRHAEEDILRKSSAQLEDEAQAIARSRGLKLTVKLIQGTASIACANGLVQQLDRAVNHAQKNVPHLVSGAGHDAVILSRLTPVGMLFVRCKDGLSHHPAEHVSEDDIAAAQTALTRFLWDFS